MKNLIKFLFISLLVSQGFVAYASGDFWGNCNEAEELAAVLLKMTLQQPIPFKDIDFKEGAKLTSGDQPIFLECSKADCNAKGLCSTRIFDIKIKDNSIKVGHIDILYNAKDKVIELGYAEIDDSYKGNRFGPMAAQIVIDEFRKSRFDCLGFNEYVARARPGNKYNVTKILGHLGFKLDESTTNQTYQRFTLKR